MTATADRCAAFLARHFPDGGTWTAAEIAAILARPGGFVFETDAGVMIVSAVADEAEIWTLAVATDQRRRGHARRLLEQAIERLAAAGIARLHLECAADNAAALGLYESLGFRTVGRRRDYYLRPGGGRVDAITMERKLPQ